MHSFHPLSALAVNALAFPEPKSGSTVSTDGSCGGSITCAGSTFGSYYSQYGYIGSSSAHCGSGCQFAFRIRGVVSSSTGESSTPAPSSKATIFQQRRHHPPRLPHFENLQPLRPHPQEAQPQAVTNPSFESGLAGWTGTGGASTSKRLRRRPMGLLHLRWKTLHVPHPVISLTHSTASLEFTLHRTHTNSTLTQSLSGLMFIKESTSRLRGVNTSFEGYRAIQRIRMIRKETKLI
ncbi:hypothetical protein K432DRAFT_46499 [Lepidopterella palustris CBS 459.81]|uniref:Uncharacterized protein n=1 Tax=Lepidopterella palustris CBS 459.81 TaxID=1314670 RepID=A0A8E2JJV9_9PEZI|nr:hypothetical protein K432DRAFT_46499 [Lepidopterella palustris CBS 459.81]